MSESLHPNDLLARLFQDDVGFQEEAIAMLEASAVLRQALEPNVRFRLADAQPANRISAAYILARVYDDTEPGLRLFRESEPVGLAHFGNRAGCFLRHLGDGAATLLAEVWHWWPCLQPHLPADVLDAIAWGWLRGGPTGLEVWQRAVDALDNRTAGLLILVLAEAAPVLDYDLQPAVERLRAGLKSQHTAHAAGAALWRITWRVNRDWLTELTPDDPAVQADPELPRVLTDVLIEHLGRRPDLAPRVARFLVLLHQTAAEDVGPRIARLARLGPPGWGPLLALLRDAPDAPPAVKQAVFHVSVSHPGLLGLVHPHAHRVVSARADHYNNVPAELIAPACVALAALGPAAATALPELLRLTLKEPVFGAACGRAAAAVAPGFPLAASTLIRAIGELRWKTASTMDLRLAFSALAEALAALNPDAAPALVDDTSVELETVDALLGDPAWRSMASEHRQRHVRILADRLGSSRQPVRERAAALLRHYAVELPAVWPALVAALTGPDDVSVAAVLPYFRVLTPVAAAVEADLGELLRDRNPGYVARAVFALWRLGRFAELAAAIRAAVLSEPGQTQAADALRRMVHFVAPVRGMQADANAVTDRLLAVFNPPETGEDQRLAAMLLETAPGQTSVDWKGIDNLIGSDPAGPLLYVALMAEYGTEGTGSKKIWLIKAQRGFTGCGLAEAKGNVEKAQELFGAPFSLEAQREGIRVFFHKAPVPPSYVRDLLDNPASWFRWAGLVLIDGWQPRPAELDFAVEERAFDPSRRVRARALRMTHG